MKDIISTSREQLAKEGIKIDLLTVMSEGYIYAIINDLDDDKISTFIDMLGDKVPMGLVHLQSGSVTATDFLHQYNMSG